MFVSQSNCPTPKLSRSRFSIWLALSLFLFSGLASAQVQDEAAAAESVESTEETKKFAPIAQVGELLEALISQGVDLTGKTLQIVLVPVDQLRPKKKTQSETAADDSIKAKPAPDPDAAIAAEPSEPKTPFLPATMLESRLTTELDVNFAINQMLTRRETSSESKVKRSSRGPSGTLLAVLRENERRSALKPPTTPDLSRRSPGVQLAATTTIPPKPAPAKPDADAEKDDEDDPSKFVLVALLDEIGNIRLPNLPDKAEPDTAEAKPSAQPGETSPPEAKPKKEREPMKLAMLFTRPKKAETKEEEPAESGPVQEINVAGQTFAFNTVSAPRAPFHVFDVDPSETILIEIDSDSIGRVQSKGKEWAWLQLDSGLMGVMRNKYLRDSSRTEIMRYLAVESGSGGGPAQQVDVSIVNLDSRSLPTKQLDLEASPAGSTSLPMAPPSSTIDTGTEGKLNNAN